MVTGPTTFWRDSVTRRQLQALMNLRAAAGKSRLRVYADKIYTTSHVIVSAWSLRGGPLQPWMVNENRLMSRLRVAVEWAFNDIKMFFKSLNLKSHQKLRASPIIPQFVVATLICNVKTILYQHGPV